MNSKTKLVHFIIYVTISIIIISTLNTNKSIYLKLIIWFFSIRNFISISKNEFYSRFLPFRFFNYLNTIIKGFGLINFAFIFTFYIIFSFSLINYSIDYLFPLSNIISDQNKEFHLSLLVICGVLYSLIKLLFYGLSEDEESPKLRNLRKYNLAFFSIFYIYFLKVVALDDLYYSIVPFMFTIVFIFSIIPLLDFNSLISFAKGNGAEKTLSEIRKNCFTYFTIISYYFLIIFILNNRFETVNIFLSKNSFLISSFFVVLTVWFHSIKPLGKNTTEVMENNLKDPKDEEDV